MTLSNISPKLDRRTFLGVAGGGLTSLAAGQTFGATLAPKGRGLVVGHPEGAEVGMTVLADGGNAIDAITAAALVAGVMDVSRCGIGGYGGHMTIGLPSGRVTCIDFNSEAPKAARPDMFPLDSMGNVKGNVNMHGWLSAGVPATLAGIQLAIDKYGSQPFARLVGPAIRYAREGFPVIWTINSYLQRDPGSARLFMRGGKPLPRGATFRNPDLAAMLQKLADKGSVVDFYRGEIAHRIADAFQKNGGLVTDNDMASYRPLELAPHTLEWNGHTIATAPLTAGGLTILQTIQAIKALAPDWKRLPKDSPVRSHTWLEALRVSWGDRLQLFGDPRQANVPIERLLSENYAQESAAKIRSAVAEKRPVPVTTDNRMAGGTVHLSAVDANGMMVAMTLTHGNSYGAQVTVDGLGLLLGHGNSRFDPAPGKPNSIGPGKRPLDNMCPTIVLRGGRPVLSIGAVGGRRIPNALFQVLMKLLEDGSSLEGAITDPRLHTEGGMIVRAESGRPESDINYLKQMGYTIGKPEVCWVSAVEIDPTKQDRVAVGVFDHGKDIPAAAMRNPHPVVTHANL